MILYRKSAQLRTKRFSAPEGPFWAASSVAPYSARRAAPLSIDYLTLRAVGAERLDVVVSDHVADSLERAAALDGPVLIDAAETAEVVFRRGEEALESCQELGLATIHLVSTRSALPRRAHERSTTVIAAWPLEAARLEAMFAAAAERGATWGVLVPVVFPVTTELEALTRIADAARERGARFLTGVPIDLEPTARQALAQALELSADDDRYALLFHGGVEAIHLATERHIAALAAERRLADFIVPPEWEQRSNWSAAVLLTLTASRMIAMELDLDLAGSIARSARVVAELDKPLARIAESASLSIVGGLDETSVEMLTQWLATGAAAFVEFVDEQWRMRRDGY